MFVQIFKDMVHSILPLLNEHIWLRHAGIINWPFHLIYQYQIKIKFKKRNAQKGKLTGLGTGATQPPQLQARWMAQQQQPCLPCHTHHRVLHRKTHKNLKGNQTEAVSQEGPITKNAIQNNRHTDMPVLLFCFFYQSLVLFVKTQHLKVIKLQPWCCHFVPSGLY